MSEDVVRQNFERLNAELGRQAFSLCYEVFLYSTASRTRCRPGILAAVDALQDAFKGSLAWYKTNTMKLPKRVGTSTREVAGNYLESIDGKPPKLAGLQLHSGVKQDTYTPPALAFFSTIVPTDRSDKRESRTYLRLGVPVDVGDAPTFLRQLCRTILEEWPLFAGHCGWSYYWSNVDDDEERLLDANAGAWLKRFPGLSYGDPLSFLEFIGDGLLSVSWLTYVDRSACQARGQTPEQLLERCREEGVPTEILHGRVLEIEAAPAPALGDRNRNDRLPGYCKVGELLSFMKLTGEQSGYLPILSMEGEERTEWYERFFEAE